MQQSRLLNILKLIDIIEILWKYWEDTFALSFIRARYFLGRSEVDDSPHNFYVEYPTLCFGNTRGIAPSQCCVLPIGRQIQQYPQLVRIQRDSSEFSGEVQATADILCGK